MRIELSHSALKFLEKQDDKTKTRVFKKIKYLINSIEESGVIPYKTLDIKSLHGFWHPHKRLRIGKTRIIFIIDSDSNTIKISEIDGRGDIY